MFLGSTSPFLLRAICNFLSSVPSSCWHYSLPEQEASSQLLVTAACYHSLIIITGFLLNTVISISSHKKQHLHYHAFPWQHHHSFPVENCATCPQNSHDHFLAPNSIHVNIVIAETIHIILI